MLSERADLDPFDLKILKVLQENADLSNVELADLIGLSPSACLRRVARLKETGAIRRISAEIDPQYLGFGLTALVAVRLERHGREHRRAFMDSVRVEPAISLAYMVAGDESCFLLIHLRDMDHYTDLVDRILHSDANVVSHATHFVIGEVKSRSTVSAALHLPDLS